MDKLYTDIPNISKEYDSVEDALQEENKIVGDYIKVKGKTYVLNKADDKWKAIKIMTTDTILQEYKDGYNRIFNFLYMLRESVDESSKRKIDCFLVDECAVLKDLITG